MNNTGEFVRVDENHVDQKFKWDGVQENIKDGFNNRMTDRTDPNLVKDVNGFDTVSHGYCILWLNRYFPGWSFEEKQFFAVGPELNETIICTGQLKVVDNMCNRSIPGTGSHKVGYPKKGGSVPINIGYSYSAAESEAIKKAASRLGFAPDIYILNNRPPYSVVETLQSEAESEHLSEEQRTKYQRYVDTVSKDKASDLLRFLKDQVAEALARNKGGASGQE